MTERWDDIPTPTVSVNIDERAVVLDAPGIVKLKMSISAARLLASKLRTAVEMLGEGEPVTL